MAVIRLNSRQFKAYVVLRGLVVERRVVFELRRKPEPVKRNSQRIRGSDKPHKLRDVRCHDGVGPPVGSPSADNLMRKILRQAQLGFTDRG